MQRCSGLLNRRARGSTVTTHQFQAAVAQQRQQQFRKLPGNPPHGSASLPVGPILCSRSSSYQSGRLRTAITGEIPAGSAIFSRVSPTTRGTPLRTERLGVEIPHAAPFRPLVVQCRDGALKTRTVSVQFRPWAPTACSPISRGVPLKPGRLQVRILPRGPILECQPGKRTGPVC